MLSPQSDRLVALDLLRGLAAVAVVVLHFPWPADGADPLPRGYLAVDLFFILSGFVLARTYWHDLSQGRGAGTFLIQRLVRLYPLYLLATLIGAAYALVNGAPLGAWMAAFGANLLFLPAPPDSGFGPNLFPFVFPAWSLLWELAANLFLAAIAMRLRSPLLPAILVIGLVMVALTARHFGSLDAGPRWIDIAGGGSRVLYGFFAGVALFLVHARLGRRIVLPDWLLGLAMLMTFAPGPAGAFGAGYDVLAATILFPLIVLLAADARTTALSRRAGAALGGISYAIYVLHQPIAQLLSLILPDAQLGASGIAGLAGIVLLTLAAAWAATRWIDTPIRRWIKRRRAQPVPAGAKLTTSSPAAP